MTLHQVDFLELDIRAHILSSILDIMLVWQQFMVIPAGISMQIRP